MPKTPPTPQKTNVKVPPLDPESCFYQAVGTLFGEVSVDDQGYHIDIEGFSFPIFFPRTVATAAKSLIGTGPRFFRCWPQRKGKPDAPLTFTVLGWREEGDPKWPSGIFLLRGIWQFIPQIKRPVLSIYRNQLQSWELRSCTQHLPLLWAEAPTPFRWSPKSTDKPVFYQLATRFVPSKGTFLVLSNLAEPSIPPRRVKTTPKMKVSDKKNKKISEKPIPPKLKPVKPTEHKKKSQNTKPSLGLGLSKDNRGQ